MKYLTILGLAAAMTAGAVPAVAQMYPPPNPQMQQQFRQMRTQMEQIRTTERSQILGALTPAHKSLLASIAGQLATSVNPDYRAAEQQLDSALSASEKQAIINASQNARTKARSLMSQMRSQFPMPSGPMRSPSANRPNRTPDAGRLLLRIAMAPGPGMMGPMRMHP